MLFVNQTTMLQHYLCTQAPAKMFCQRRHQAANTLCTEKHDSTKEQWFTTCTHKITMPRFQEKHD